MITIDGSMGEGGGQLLRSALALSSLTQQPFRMHDIRANRPQKGLRAQHLCCITAHQQLFGAKLDGATLGSCELLFIPGNKEPKSMHLDIGTAGSIPLLLQSLLLPCMFSQKSHSLTITGGTDVPFSPSYDYFNQIVIPHYRRFCGITLNLLKRGYYPAGGGQVTLRFAPIFSRNSFDTFSAFCAALSHKKFFLQEQGSIASIKGIAHASNNLSKSGIAERMALAAKTALAPLHAPIALETHYFETRSLGFGLTLWAIFGRGDEVDFENPIRIGADSLGDDHQSPEHVGTTAAQKLISEIKTYAPVDSHLADNLIPLLALARGSTIAASTITSHTLTNISLIEQFFGQIFTRKNNTLFS